MVHFFRAEISRANVWRQRLDTTTNWAVLTTGAAISLAFSEGIAGHRVIMLNMLLITLLLYIEARRYRYYELWSSRVRLMETDFFASMLVPPFHPASDWAESLAENLLHPQFPISMLEAFGRRFRRNYFWIYVILWLAWVSKEWLQPTAAQSWSEFLSRDGMGGLSGAVVLTAGLLTSGKKIEEPYILRNMVANTLPGEQHEIKILRDGKARTLTIIIGELPSDAQQPVEAGDFQNALKGVSVQDLNPELSRKLKVPEKIKGVIVSDVEESSVAAGALMQGDIIQEVNRKKVTDVKSYKDVVARIKKDESVLLLIFRGGSSLFVTLTQK